MRRVVSLAGWERFSVVLFAVVLCMVGCDGAANPVQQSITGRVKESEHGEVGRQQYTGDDDQRSYAPGNDYDVQQGYGESPSFAASGQGYDNGSTYASSPYGGAAGTSAGGDVPPNQGAPPPDQIAQGSGNGLGSTTSQGNRYQRTRVRLNRPVALAQTGPNGTMMSFAIEYEFTQGVPSSRSRYFLVIKGRQQGIRAELDLGTIRNRGGFTGFVDGWRPEYGPYEATMEEAYADGTRGVISTKTVFPQ